MIAAQPVSAGTRRTDSNRCLTVISFRYDEDTKTTESEVHMKRVVISLLVVCLFAPALIARDKPAPTAPGTYKEWGRDIDQIEIVKTFKIADYDHIVVQTFETSASPLPDKNDKSYNNIKAVLDGYTLT